MKKKFIFLAMIGLFQISRSQEYLFSIEPQGGGLFYLAKSDAFTTIKQSPNFDGGILISYQANQFLQLKTGVSVFSKRFSEYFSWPTPPPNNSYEIENHIGLYYIRFPVLFSVRLLNQGKFSYNADFGFSLGYLFYMYRRATLYDNTSSNGFNGLTYYYQNPLFMEFALPVSYRLSNKIQISAELWYRYMYINDFLKVQNAYYISLSHSQLGLSAGLIYGLVLKKR